MLMRRTSTRRCQQAGLGVADGSGRVLLSALD